MQRGTKHTDETRAKQSQAALRRPTVSAETRAKLSASTKAMWAARKAANVNCPR